MTPATAAQTQFDPRGFTGVTIPTSEGNLDRQSAPVSYIVAPNSALERELPAKSQRRQAKADLDEKIRVERESFLDNVSREINNSKRILNYPKNWDDDGAPRISREAFNASRRFLEQVCPRVFDALACKKGSAPTLSIPVISPGSEGSTIVVWRTLQGGFLAEFYTDRVEVFVEHLHPKSSSNMVYRDTGLLEDIMVKWIAGFC